MCSWSRRREALRQRWVDDGAQGAEQVPVPGDSHPSGRVGDWGPEESTGASYLAEASRSHPGHFRPPGRG